MDEFADEIRALFDEPVEALRAAEPGVAGGDVRTAQIAGCQKALIAIARRIQQIEDRLDHR